MRFVPERLVTLRHLKEMSMRALGGTSECISFSNLELRERGGSAQARRSCPFGKGFWGFHRIFFLGPSHYRSLQFPTAKQAI